VPPGRLSVVGTGIRAISQVTLEARDRIRAADVVLYVVADPVTERWIRAESGRAESLHGLYREGRSRHEAYEAMVDAILSAVRSGADVCAAFYGHPGVFALPGREAVRRARLEGFGAELLPGVSAEDCLFADLGVDPAERGCQSYEATDFLHRRPTVDTAVPLVLWQVGVVGERSHRERPKPVALADLAALLAGLYGPGHEVVLYEAATYFVTGPRVDRVPVAELDESAVSAMTTVLVPPAPGATGTT
jgi:uncharacterized protein YabN with tetrapyrrole methylase and pyrophosphatase domain